MNFKAGDWVRLDRELEGYNDRKNSPRKHSVVKLDAIFNNSNYSSFTYRGELFYLTLTHGVSLVTDENEIALAALGN